MVVRCLSLDTFATYFLLKLYVYATLRMCPLVRHHGATRVEVYQNVRSFMYVFVLLSGTSVNSTCPQKTIYYTCNLRASYALPPSQPAAADFYGLATTSCSSSLLPFFLAVLHDPLGWGPT
jgi:hypothetical protein